MKKNMKTARPLLLMIWMAFSWLSSTAQTSSLVVFNELKEDFTLYINGTRVNAVPCQHLRVTDLKPTLYKVEAQFVNQVLPRPAIEILISSGRETSYAIMRDPNGKAPLAFHFLSEFSTGYFPIAPQSAMVVTYTGPMTAVIPAPTPNPVQPQVIVIPPTEPVRPNPLPGYNGPVGCPYPMDPFDFEEAKKTIAAKSFSDTKMQLAKQVTRNNCLLTKQVIEFMTLFSFESQKLEFAKYAYDFTYDRGNYYKINEAFGFESSVRDLEKYLQQK
jgi:hypothetical protein